MCKVDSQNQKLGIEYVGFTKSTVSNFAILETRVCTGNGFTPKELGAEKAGGQKYKPFERSIRIISVHVPLQKAESCVRPYELGMVKG